MLFQLIKNINNNLLVIYLNVKYNMEKEYIINELLKEKTNLEAIDYLKNIIKELEKNSLGNRVINLLSDKDYIEKYQPNELYNWTLIYDYEKLNGDVLEIYFDIDYNYYIKGNFITLNIKTFEVYASLEDPFAYCGGEDEIKKIIFSSKNILRKKKIQNILEKI